MKGTGETPHYLSEFIIPEEYKDFLKSIITPRLRALTDRNWLSILTFFNALQIRSELGNITTKDFTEDWDGWIIDWKEYCTIGNRSNATTVPKINELHFEEFVSTLVTLGVYEVSESEKLNISEQVNNIVGTPKQS